ncbi:MAG: LysR family transcriptional regulator [Thiothrix sp.]|nr:LysR family transcriptional regulator [Thiothrix sp.]HPQ95858.1 LysR family transcriptional regulator [Thiolinea sp.]
MDLRQLRYFLEIVEQGSLTRASETLHVAQPALSFHLRNMEEHLGARLLFRGSTGVRPTEAGELLTRRARLILNEMARTEDEIRNLENDPSGQLRIGLPGTIGDIITLPLIQRLRQRYPRITLNIAEAMSGFVAQWLAEGRVDLAVLYTRPAQPGMVAEQLLEEELVLVFPPGAANRAEMPLAALADVALVLPSPEHGLRMTIDAVLQPLDIRPPIALEIDSYRSIKRLVAAGYGASILPRHAVAQEVGEGRLLARRISAPGLWRGAWLMHVSNRPVTRVQAVVSGVLKEVVGELLVSGAWAAARVPG